MESDEGSGRDGRVDLAQLEAEVVLTAQGDSGMTLAVSRLAASAEVIMGPQQQQQFRTGRPSTTTPDLFGDAHSHTEC